MSLEFKVDTIPEGLEEYYKKADDGFVLDVNGFTDLSEELNTTKAEAEDTKQKLKEFREHNITLRKSLESQATGTSGDGKPPNIQSAIEEAVSELKEKMNTVSKERDVIKSRLEEVVLSDKVKDIAVKYGVHETALPDVVTRARSMFTVSDGTPVPINDKSRDENGELYTPESWIKKLEADAPHLFKPSTGTGAKHSVKGGVSATELTSTQKIAAGLTTMGGSKAKNVM